MIIDSQKRKHFSGKIKFLAFGLSGLLGYGFYNIINRPDNDDNLEFLKSDVNNPLDLGDDWYNYVSINLNNTAPDYSCIIGDNLARNSDPSNVFNYWNLTEFINYRNMTLLHPSYGKVNYLVYDALCDERDHLYLPNANKTRVMEELKQGNFTYSFGMQIHDNVGELEGGDFVVGGFRFFPYEDIDEIIGMNITKAVVFSLVSYEDSLGELIIQSGDQVRSVNNTMTDFKNGRSAKDVNLFLKPGFVNITLNHGLIGRLEMNNIVVGEDFPRSDIYNDAFILSGDFLRKFLEDE